MKKFSILSAVVALSFAVVFTACQDDILDDVDAAGEGAAFDQIIGNGGQQFITTDLNLSGAVQLRGLVRISNGAKVTIAAGTVIRATPGPVGGTPGTLLIERGSQIIANGTAQSPIVFTTTRNGQGARQPGSIGGLIILGNDFTNVKSGTNGAPQNYVGAIEGIPASFSPGLYGNPAGSDAFFGESSGILRYVRIEYAGNVLTEGNETNGLTLGGVGAGTVLDHVMVSFGADDGFEFFGGSVNGKYLFGYRNVDDDFDTDQGYDGNVQFALAVKDPFILDATNPFTGQPFTTSESRGFESNGDEDDAVDQTRLTNATFANVTLYGHQNPFTADCFTAVNGAKADYGVVVRDGSRLDLYNSKILGFRDAQYAIENPTDLINNVANVRGVRAVGANSPGSIAARRSDTDANINFAFLAKPGNSFVKATGCYFKPAENVAGLGGQNVTAFLLPFTGNARPDYVATSTFPGAVQPVPGGFFTAVNFIGAFGSDEGNWDINSPWVEYTPADNVYPE